MLVQNGISSGINTFPMENCFIIILFFIHKEIRYVFNRCLQPGMAAARLKNGGLWTEQSNWMYTTSHSKCWIMQNHQNCRMSIVILGGKKAVPKCTYWIFAEAWYQPKTRADISCIESCIFGETLPSSYLSTSWFSRSDLHSVRGQIIPTSAWRHPNEVHADFTRLSIAGHSQEGPGGYSSLRCHCSSSFGQTEPLHLCRWFDAWWS